MLYKMLRRENKQRTSWSNGNRSMFKCFKLDNVYRGVGSEAGVLSRRDWAGTETELPSQNPPSFAYTRGGRTVAGAS